MKFAFTTALCPKWDVLSVAAKARELGFEGVEIEGMVADPGAVRERMKAEGVEIVCLSSSIAITGKASKDAVLAGEVKKYIDAAGVLGCPLVKVQDMHVPGGLSLPMGTIVLGDWLAPLGKYAAEKGIGLLVENVHSYKSAGQIWAVLDRLEEANLAVSLNVATAAMIGETPAVSVPVLNSRIRLVQVGDAKKTGKGWGWCRLGEGDVQVKDLLNRLRGIGYEGYVTLGGRCVEGEVEGYLGEGIGKLREWSAPLQVAGVEKKVVEKVA